MHDPGLDVALSPSNADSGLPSHFAVTVLKKIYVDEAKHVAHDISARLSHWQVPTSATSNLAQSREADDSCMFPLSDPE